MGGDLKPPLYWLLIALARTLAEHPSDILLPAEFYSSLRSADDTGCLTFSPTVQQLAAASLLLRGTVVEMDSGDGKTLASAIAAAVFAAAGRRVHVLTANDYLASRDCDELAPMLEPLGLSVGLVIDNMDRDERRHQYARQIVFTTARESGFDYLRDSVAPSLDWRVRPVFDVAIVDEVDHQLVDQARTPLIISDGPTHEAEAEVGDRCEDLTNEVIERQAHYVDDLYARIDEESRPDRLLAEIMLAGGLTPRLISTLERLNVSARTVRLGHDQNETTTRTAARWSRSCCLQSTLMGLLSGSPRGDGGSYGSGPTFRQRRSRWCRCSARGSYTTRTKTTLSTRTE